MIGSEIVMGLSGFKAMLDTAKALKGMSDAAIRNAAVIELQEHILAAQEQQSALIGRVRELEEEMRRFETWDTEKERYEMKGVWGGGTAYMLKPEARGSEPAHWLCPACYQQRKKGFFQPFGNIGRDHVFKCASCQAVLKTNTEPMWDLTDGR